MYSCHIFVFYTIFIVHLLLIALYGYSIFLIKEPHIGLCATEFSSYLRDVVHQDQLNYCLIPFIRIEAATLRSERPHGQLRKEQALPGSINFSMWRKRSGLRKATRQRSEGS